MIRLAGAALAVASAVLVVVGFCGIGPPLGVQNFGLVLGVICGGASAVLFIIADDPKTAQPKA
ncbi:MAG: hypothetical protein B7Y99_08530 [Caulobacterales bacterium 32-69-10]|nr:MAG: hypothetical protein B7Y99_08530 [Caulobacterales bacterium 32-69-10]